ncbi:MAG: ATPase, T2SS/T4P/T4SS family, partial [Chrysiogenales bacterium]
MAEIKPLILCVDDDQDSLKLLERFLGEDYRVLTAASGRAGLEIVREMKPDLVLLDVKMPEMDGYRMCSLLRDNEQTAYIPVIFVTALGDEQDKARAFAVGAADYLVKPIIRNLLSDKVIEHLQTNSQWHNLRKDSRSWYDKSQPAAFIQFKEFLFNKFTIDNKVRYNLSSRNPANIYALAAEMGICEDVLAKHIADFLKLPYTANINPDEIRLGVLPAAFSKHNHVLAVESSTGKNAFIISNPFDWNLADILEKLSDPDRKSSLIIPEPANIDLVFGDMPAQVDIKPASETPKPFRSGVSMEEEISEQPIEHITNAILNKAVVERASDIHIEPKEDDTKVRFRIDGDLRNALTLKKNTGIMVISRLKVLGGLDISEKRKPQDGGFVVTLKDRTFNLRLSTTSTPNGESLVMRLLEPYTEPKKLAELGMSDQQTAAMVHLVTKSSGIILIVGSTGSGKTTTIYSLLHSVDFKRRSVLSVEDPVEYRMPFVNQQQVNNKAGVTFEALLKTAVRQDPDVLFLGEVRDDFSAKIALDFSSTGHLTITTMHTSNATTALFRLERLGVDRGTMADTILAIVAQKLVKKLCPHCKETVPISPEEKTMFAAY